jgi:hypothetical protein
VVLTGYGQSFDNYSKFNLELFADGYPIISTGTSE